MYLGIVKQRPYLGSDEPHKNVTGDCLFLHAGKGDAVPQLVTCGEKKASSESVGRAGARVLYCTCMQLVQQPNQTDVLTPITHI